VGGAAVGGASAGAAGGLNDVGMGAALGVGASAIPSIAKLGGALLRNGIGGSTGVGSDALGQAFKAGQTGGKTAQQFTKNMRGGGEYDDVLNMAKQNLQAMQQQKQSAYKQGMMGIKADKSVLDMTPIDQAIASASSKVSFKGQAKNQRAAQALQEAADEVNAWRQLDPNEYHTPEGLDALKQRIGGILESLPFEQKTARTAVGDVYNSVKNEINKQAPTYADVMGGYGKASETIKEIERSLSLGQKASADTGMRKLQSLMRNNVNTNYGQRTRLASDLIGAGGQDFMPALAGQSLSDLAPRGMQRAAAGVGVPSMAVLGNIPAAAGLLALSSPRVMGEAFYGAGKLADQRLLEALRQTLPKMPILAAQSER
jgi:flagellar biosynthesis chaperone FliJ